MSRNFISCHLLVRAICWRWCRGRRHGGVAIRVASPARIGLFPRRTWLLGPAEPADQRVPEGRWPLDYCRPQAGEPIRDTQIRGSGRSRPDHSKGRGESQRGNPPVNRSTVHLLLLSASPPVPARHVSRCDLHTSPRPTLYSVCRIEYFLPCKSVATGAKRAIAPVFPQKLATAALRRNCSTLTSGSTTTFAGRKEQGISTARSSPAPRTTVRRASW
jgi:hypothetical protein